MSCDTKTMIKIAAALGLALLLAYLALPAFHAFVLASAPLLAVLVCPIGMIFMMKGMHAGKHDERAKTRDDTPIALSPPSDPDRS